MSNDAPSPAADGFPVGQTGNMRDVLLSPQTEAKPATASGPWQPPSAEELHKLLPQYEITALLGRGGMGAVYKGRQIALDRPVAIKILSNTLDEADASFAERFKNEARALGKLSHPGIVGVYDFGEAANGLLYIVMEFIDGTDVARMLAQQKRLHTEHAMAITAHVCDALAYAHERGIIHRDIKPANIMVGYDGVVKVADFGLAKMTHSQNSGLTQSGMAMGTLHYMAPEALMLGSAVDHRADIYAVGVMLYQMLTGKIPQGLFELPSLQVPGLDPRYDGIIGKALREDREVRYPSVLAMRHDLDAILTQPVVKVQPSAEKAPAALETQARPQRPGGQPYRPPQPEVIVRTEKKSSPLLWSMAIAFAALAAWLYFKQETGSATSSPSTASTTPSENPTVEKAGATPATPAVAKDDKPLVKLPVITSAPTSGSGVAEPAPVEPGFIPLLDAAHIEGWKEMGDGDSAEIIDDVLTFRPRRNWPGYYWYIAKTFSDFTLRLQYKIVTPGGNSGVPLRVTQPSSQPPEKLNYEVDVSNSTDPMQATGAIMFVKPPVAKAQKDWEWNDLEITAMGHNYRVILNGVLVNDFMGSRSTSGHIGLQIGVASVQYRHIRIKELPPPLPTGPTTWTDLKGRSLTATFKAIASGNVLLDIAGKMTPVPLNTLSTESQKLAQQMEAARKLADASDPAKAARQQPFINTLGMKFVPVPGTKVLFCVHEARHQDYAAFAEENPTINPAWQRQELDGFIPSERPGEHPVAYVSWDDADAFCQWLSRKEGRAYRLPTDQEWSVAAGIDTDENRQPGDTVENVRRPPNLFPWGRTWPPPEAAGNFSDESRRLKAPHDGSQYLDGYDDGFPTTAPVMSFSPNRMGIHDLGGNVWEWVDGWWNDQKASRVMRGGSLQDFEPSSLSLSIRNNLPSSYRNYNRGFRCVVEVAQVASAENKTAVTTSWQPSSPSGATAVPNLDSITKDKPLTNTLGMKFVPVTGTKVLFSIWETRVQDYSMFARAEKVDDSWKNRQRNGIPVARDRDHPVVAVNWEESQAFCRWLTNKETTAGKLPKGWLYRLPKDEEWSLAVGLPSEQGLTPAEKGRVNRSLFPWGNGFPPPNAKVGNYADTEWHDKFPTDSWLTGYTDGYATTAPVGSFPSNIHGLHDLGGNVWEWCDDLLTGGGTKRVLRGGCWGNSSSDDLNSACRYFFSDPETHVHSYGFRCVLQMSP